MMRIPLVFLLAKCFGYMGQDDTDNDTTHDTMGYLRTVHNEQSTYYAK